MGDMCPLVGPSQWVPPDDSTDSDDEEEHAEVEERDASSGEQSSTEDAESGAPMFVRDGDIRSLHQEWPLLRMPSTQVKSHRSFWRQEVPSGHRLSSLPTGYRAASAQALPPENYQLATRTTSYHFPYKKAGTTSYHEGSCT
jgi:hypothetical protein